MTAKRDPASPKADAAGVGRRLGVALFWILAIYVVVSATVSVVGQLQMRPEPPGSTAEQACAGTLSVLAQELEQREFVLADPASAVQPWLASWDTRWQSLEGRCGRLEATRHHLRTARLEFGQLLDDYQRRQRAELLRITRTLQPFAASE